MLTLALANLKSRARRFVAVCLAVMIGTAFLAATLMVGSSTTASLQQSVGAAYRSADVVVGIDWNAYPGAVEDSLDAGSLQAAGRVSGVEASYGRAVLSGRIDTGDAEQNALVSDYPSDGDLRSVEVASGDLPASAGDVALDETSAAKAGLAIGDSVTLASVGDAPGRATGLVLTGLTVPSSDPLAGGMMQVTVAPSFMGHLLGATPVYQQLHLRIGDGVDPAAAVADIAAALRADGIEYPSVLTAREQTVADVASLSGGQDQLTIVLLVFALVALMVTGLVVMNTFSVLVAQRTRELALLRTIGALRRQLRSAVLAEALLVGLVSSVLGVALATGIMAALVAYVATLPGSGFAVLSVTWPTVAWAVSVGTLMTLLAAWVPARNATRIAPLAALRPVDPARLRNRGGKIRLVCGGLMVVCGGILLALGAAEGDLLVAFGGGFLSFPGIMLLGSLFLPPSVAAAGALARPAGVPGRLAALNAVRNPGRTTATATALLIGVTLVSMMMVGAQTTKASLDATLGSEFPVDITVEPMGDGADFAQEDVVRIRTLDGVGSVALLRPGGTGTGETPVYAAPAADLTRVLNDPSQVPGKGQVLVAQETEGTILRVAGASGTSDLSMVKSGGAFMPAVMTSETAEALGGAARGGDSVASAAAVLWIKAVPGLGTDDALDLRTELAASLGVEEYAVGGGLMEKQMYTQVIDTLLLVVTGLLAVAVFIALVGVGNTLSLSVLERTRESSLLRALGLTRGQLRGMLALEAVLVAAVASVLGCVLGAAYGILGAQSALGSFSALVVALPWAQLAGVVAAAGIAALAASVLPARRAARMSPVAGLATE